MNLLSYEQNFKQIAIQCKTQHNMDINLFKYLRLQASKNDCRKEND